MPIYVIKLIERLKTVEEKNEAGEGEREKWWKEKEGEVRGKAERKKMGGIVRGGKWWWRRLKEKEGEGEKGWKKKVKVRKVRVGEKGERKKSQRKGERKRWGE